MAMRRTFAVLALLGGFSLFWSGLAAAGEIGRSGVYSVVELAFEGPKQAAKDMPARDVDFWVRFQHESGAAEYKVHGFFDGDGKGGAAGNVFKVRFCPTQPGRWTLAEVHSNARELIGQKQGDHVAAAPTGHHGFWVIDPDSAGQRWYKRSDGSHQFIFGNTMYSFLSGYDKDGPSGNEIARDIIGNAEYFKKLRLGLSGDRYMNPYEKPFLDDAGHPTDWGDYSCRPNPRWFRDRVDVAVRVASDRDLIADLILAGPDVEESRSTLRAYKNNGDPTPFLKYIAARYGSYPNVWICLCNEFEIKTPKYPEEQIVKFGRAIREYLPYPTPVSVHSTPRTLWPAAFDAAPQWADHQIIQHKIRKLAPAADALHQIWENGGSPRHKPTIDDELSYQGEGDKHSEGDTIESHLGAFLGGGYGTTGEKPANKEGQYFRGKFNPVEHSAADNLKWLRETIDTRIAFWKMAPDLAIFENLDGGFRGMAWAGNEYVLGTNKPQRAIVAKLPAGRWTVTCYDVMRMKGTVIDNQASGRFTFDAPASRAALFHFKKSPLPGASR